MAQTLQRLQKKRALNRMVVQEPNHYKSDSYSMRFHEG